MDIAQLGLSVDSRGVVRGTSDLDKMTGAAKRTESATTKMAASIDRDVGRIQSTLSNAQRLLVGFFGIAGATRFASGLARVADEYANIQAKLRLVTADQAGLGRATQAVFAISQRTYSSLDSTTTLVSRTTRALISNGEEAGRALTKSLALSETIQQAFAVSGATNAESKNAIIQLSQGLAAGALRGEEYNSVAEQGSRITQALARHLKLTTGELRAMAAEGKLTAEVVQQALTGEAGKIAAEFAQLPMTISRSMQVLDNAWTKFIGEADTAAGVSRTVAEAIASIGTNLGPLLGALTNVAALTVAAFAGKGLQAMLAYGRGAMQAVAAQSALNDIERLSAAAAVQSAQAKSTETAATLAAVAAARQEIVAKQQLAATEAARVATIAEVTASAAARATALKMYSTQEQQAILRTQAVEADAAAQSARVAALDIARTLEVVEASRAQWAATQQMSIAEVARAQRTLEATKAIGFQSAALRQQRIATDELAAAQARLRLVTNEYAGLGQQQGRVQGQLAASAAAQVSAQARAAELARTVQIIDAANREALAKGRVNDATRELATLGQQQARLQTQLATGATAQIAAQTRLAGTLTATQVIFGALSSGAAKLGSGLLALAGGPIGVTIGVLGAMYFSMKNAEEAAAAFEGRVKSVAQALDDFNQTGLQGDLEGLFNPESGTNRAADLVAEINTEIQQLNILALEAERRMQFGKGGGADLARIAARTDELNAKLEVLRPRLEAAKDAFVGFVREALNFGKSQQTVARDMNEWYQDMEKGSGKLQEQIIKIRDGEQALQEYIAMQAAGVESTDQLTEAQRKEIANRVALQKTLDDLNQAKKDGVTATRAALKDERTASRDAEQAAQALAQAWRDATQAAVEQRGAISPLHEVMAEYETGMYEAALAAQELADKGVAESEVNAILASSIETLKKIRDADTLAAKKNIAQRELNGPQKLLSAMSKEIQLLGLATRERNRAVIAMRAQEDMLAAIKEANENGAGIGPEVAKSMLETAEAMAETIAKASELDEILSQFEDYGMDPLLKAIGDVGDALADAMSQAGPPTEEMLAYMKRLQEGMGFLGSEYLQQSVGGLRDMAEAMGSLFEEGSSGQKKMAQAAAALTVVQAALATVEGVRAIVQQGTKGDPYTAFGRMAAMAAAVAPLIAAIGGAIPAFGGGGGPSAQSAEVRQAQQGTGSILGDAEAKSESILNAMEITANATSELVGINRGMLHALQSLESGIGSASGMIARGGATVDAGSLDSGGLLGLPTLGLANAIFGGKQELIDQGIVIMGGALNDMLSNITVGAYNTIETDGGWFSSDDVDTNVTDITDEFGEQFQLILRSIVDTVREGALALGMSRSEIDAALERYRVEEIKISLKDLTAEEQQAEVQAVLSSIFDGFAGHVVKWLPQFQQLGEGLGETLVRVATGVQVTQEAVLQLGFALDETDPEKFAQISEGLIELMGGIEGFIEGMSTFVNAFATDEHKFSVAQNALTRAFAEAGIAIPATREGMWELMQSLDATTESGRQQIAMLLQVAGHADAYYTMLEDRAETAADAAREAAEIAREAEEARMDGMREYAGLVSSLNRQIFDSMDASDFARAWAEARVARDQNTAALYAAAAASGVATARQEDLNLATELYGRQMAKATRVLRQSAQEAVRGLGYDAASQVDAQIAALQEQESLAASAMSSFSDAMGETAQAASNAMQLLLGDLSPLKDAQKLPMALQALRRGEIGGEDVLRIAQRMYSSGADYNRVFDEVQAIVARQGSPGAAVGGGSYDAGNAVSPAMQALIDERDRLAKERERGQRFGQANELAQYVADLSLATGQSFEEVIASLGFTAEQLMADLGLGDSTALNELLTALRAESTSFAELYTRATFGEQEIINSLNAIYQLMGGTGDPLLNPPPPLEPPGDKGPGATTKAVADAEERHAQVVEMLEARLKEMQEAQQRSDALLAAILARIDANTGSTAGSAAQIVSGGLIDATRAAGAESRTAAKPVIRTAAKP